MFTTHSADLHVSTTPEQLAPHPVPATMRWIDELADARRAVKAARRAARAQAETDRPDMRQVPALVRRWEH